MTDEQKQEIKSEFRSKYYNAVSDVCFDVLAKKNIETTLTKKEYEDIISDSHEWFMIHFFDEFDVKDAD